MNHRCVTVNFAACSSGSLPHVRADVCVRRPMATRRQRCISPALFLLAPQGPGFGSLVSGQADDHLQLRPGWVRLRGALGRVRFRLQGLVARVPERSPACRSAEARTRPYRDEVRPSSLELRSSDSCGTWQATSEFAAFRDVYGRRDRFGNRSPGKRLTRALLD